MPDADPFHGAFDPQFDDTVWNTGWLQAPIALPRPGKHPSGYEIVRTVIRDAEVFGRPYHLSAPLECRVLLDPRGRLWMSTTPQEHIMMYNNALRSGGHVLVGGLGLGLYPQYAAKGAAGQATRFTVVERSAAVKTIVEPVLYETLRVPFSVIVGDVEAFLAGPVTARYDTVFLDTWDTLDAASLPAINRLRDLAFRHLAPGGRVLLWGYRWMVRLFEDACVQLLSLPPNERERWLSLRGKSSPQAVELLTPVAAHFRGREIDDMNEALEWCRNLIVTSSTDTPP